MTDKERAQEGSARRGAAKELPAEGVPLKRVATRETLLFLDDPPVDSESGVMSSALLAIESLDPIQQAGVVENPAGFRLLPGFVPLAPITFGGFVLFAVGMSTSMVYSIRLDERYLFAFAIAHAVLLGHLWTYHVGYRTGRRFVTLRQALLTTVFVVFIDWMLVELIEETPEGASLLWATLACDSIASGAVFLHWLILGRGFRVRTRRPYITESDAAPENDPNNEQSELGHTTSHDTDVTPGNDGD